MEGLGAGLASGLWGGALIGLAATLLLLAAGRVLGASGALGGLLTLHWGAEPRWRLLLVTGLLGGAALAAWGVGGSDLHYPGVGVTLLGGLLVGAGTTLAQGCTSGHGVCGLARLSPRSLVATATFMGVAMLTVLVLRP